MTEEEQKKIEDEVLDLIEQAKTLQNEYDDLHKEKEES